MLRPEIGYSFRSQAISWSKLIDFMTAVPWGSERKSQWRRFPTQGSVFSSVQLALVGRIFFLPRDFPNTPFSGRTRSGTDMAVLRPLLKLSLLVAIAAISNASFSIYSAQCRSRCQSTVSWTAGLVYPTARSSAAFLQRMICSCWI